MWHYVNSTLKGHRKVFTHFGVKLSDRFPPVSLAEEAITKVREAIRDIYARLGKSSPAWVAHNESGGWPQRRNSSAGAHMTALEKGASPSTPGVVKIVLVTPQGEEKPPRYLRPSATDDEIFWWIEDYLEKLGVPFKAIRAYRGDELIYDEDLEVR